MKIKIGVLGPDDSIKRINYVASQFDMVELVNFPYKQVGEIDKVMEENRYEVDQWFFSGQSPYFYALENGLIREKEGSFPPLHGSSFFGAMLESQIQEDKVLKKISIDTISSAEIETAKHFHSFEHLSIFAYPYEGYRNADELVEFHRSLYEKGEIEAAITCIQSVQRRLRELGIPCYRVVPTNLSIQMILKFLMERAYSSKYRKSQIAIVGIEVIYSTQKLDESHFSFKMKHEELDLKRNLLDLAEKINGSLVQLGDGLFFIYSTRGELDLQKGDSMFAELIREVKLHSNLDIRIGVGFGVTVLEAEHHVRLAFQTARKHNSSIVVSVDEDKQITETLPSQEKIMFSMKNLGEEWAVKLKNASISPAIVSKIQSLAKHYEKDTFSSHDISRWLKSTERNGRRILVEMERLGLVKISGEEQSGGRGRPRKIYQFAI